MGPSSILTLVTALAFVTASPRARPVQAAASDPVTRWSVAAANAAAASGMPPLRTPITLALLHLAMYDATNAVLGGREPYAVAPEVVRPASADAAAIEAGYRVLLAELPTQHAALGALRQELLGAVPEGPAKANGSAVGASVAASLLVLRAADGRNATIAPTPGSGPGAWAPTPPGFLQPTTEFLGRVKPFTMESPSQFRPAGPTRLSSNRWAEDYDEVRTLGAKAGSTRTVEQTATALFWEPLAGTVWPATIRRLAAEQGLDLADSARFQAAAFAAFADALIGCWDAKFHYHFWRPVTAIRNGEVDGNDRTAADPDWEPLSITPAFPEYPSGHACATAAVTHVLEDLLPHDVLIPARNALTGEERLYRRASDVVDEVVEARMLIGVHFRTSNEDGAEIGRKVARQIRSRWFRPRP
jgi:hypothetical protein